MKLYELKPGSTPLKQVPEVPEGLNKVGAGHWQTYCQTLLNHGLLCEEYLQGLYDLCWWEQQAETMRKKVDKNGACHEYHDDDGNVKHTQRSGDFLALDKAQSNIRSLRADYGFTATGKLKLAKPKGQDKGYEKGKTQNY